MRVRRLAVRGMAPRVAAASRCATAALRVTAATLCATAALRVAAASLWATAALWPAVPAPLWAAEPAAPRIEARSQTLLAVAVVHGDRMTIHLSSLLDNAPVHDAVVTVLLRGVLHPTVAEADGGYSVQSKDVSLPGSAAVEFQVVRGPAAEVLKGTLQVAAGANASPENNNARQLWWWVLNFAVCIGFLMLISRRRKAARVD